MNLSSKIVLSVSSLLNLALCIVSFWFMVFATGPHLDDVTMRVGFYVMNLIALAALVAVVVPWIGAYRRHTTAALIIAVLPAAMTVAAVLAFLTLDSWLNRTFSVIAPVGLDVAGLGIRRYDL